MNIFTEKGEPAGSDSLPLPYWRNNVSGAIAMTNSHCTSHSSFLDQRMLD